MVITDPSAVRTREKVTRGGPDGTAARWAAACLALAGGRGLALSATGCAAAHAARPRTDRRAAARRMRSRRITVTDTFCRMSVKRA
jgi:hypothetical protein